MREGVRREDYHVIKSRFVDQKKEEYEPKKERETNMINKQDMKHPH